jgi:cytochrome b subunit of formate dehydrogenase
MCGSCHGDAALARRHNLPDVVSSYRETYHGKAVQFGSRRAPDCMDCHVREGESVHAMHGRNDPRSSVHTANKAATCRTAECHPGAGSALAGFRVHADRDPARHPLEFAVGLFFVVATLGLLLPILTLSVLGLIRELFPSHRAEEELDRLTEVAERKALKEGALVRFTLGHRLQHAFLISCFAVLCLTGFPLKFPDTSWAPVLLELFGGIESAPIVHRVAGVALLLGFLVHVLTILRFVRRSLARKGEHGSHAWAREILRLPMIPTWQDLRDLLGWAKYVCFLSPDRPKFGRFSWKEKLEYLGLFWGIPLLGVTGILLWAEDLTSHVLPGWAINVAYLAHTYESFLAVAHITLVHIPGIIGRPGMSPISGMLFGHVDPHVLAEEHGGQVEAWRPAEETGS